MSKEIAVRDANGLQVYTPQGLIGVAANLSNSDIQMPSLMLMQANSTFVEEDDNINSGDFIHSITKEVWGKKDKESVSLIFFDLFKTQIISDVTEKKKWIRTMPWNEDMELDPFEEEVKGRLIRREKCFNYMCFRSLELREMTNPVTGEVVHTASPIVVKFKGGSLKNGKRLNQIFDDFASFGAPSWACNFELTAKLEEKDGSKYWAYDFKKGEQACAEMQKAAGLLCTRMAKIKNSLNVVDTEESGPRNVNETKHVKNYAPGGDIV